MGSSHPIKQIKEKQKCRNQTHKPTQQKTRYCLSLRETFKAEIIEGDYFTVFYPTEANTGQKICQHENITQAEWMADSFNTWSAEM